MDAMAKCRPLVTLKNRKPGFFRNFLQPQKTLKSPGKQKQSLKTLWTDQNKINLYQNDRNENVFRREGTPYELKYIPSSGKHSGDSISMCVSASGTGPVVFLIMWLHKEVAGWILMCTRLFIQIQWIEGSLQWKWVTTQKTKHSQTTQQFLKATVNIFS